MNKYFLFVIITCAYAIAIAQTDNRIIIGTVDSVQSKILNEKRQIWVHVPESDPVGLFSSVRYPVVYLLDGDDHFSSVVGMIERMNHSSANPVSPDMIVVGIPNTNRTRDLTPTKSAIDPPFVEDSSMIKISGGGEKFMSFIEKELIPYIDSIYPTAPYRIFIGHSLGGLMVMNAVVNHPKLFTSYICIDPSMWWNKATFLKTVENTLSTENFKGKTLYLGIANTLEDGMDISTVRNDTTSESRHIRSILELDDFIKADHPKDLRYASKYYPDDDHNSAAMITEYDALRFIFKGFQFELSTKYLFDTTFNLAAMIENHYAENVSKIYGYKVFPPETLMNMFGYQLLIMKQLTKAGDFFEMNVKNYPDSYNAYDSYGDYYRAIDNKVKAIENYKKALTLNSGLTITKEKLEKLEE